MLGQRYNGYKKISISILTDVLPIFFSPLSVKDGILKPL